MILRALKHCAGERKLWVCLSMFYISLVFNGDNCLLFFPFHFIVFVRSTYALFKHSFPHCCLSNTSHSVNRAKYTLHIVSTEPNIHFTMAICLPFGDPNTKWNLYCPSVAAAVIFSILFGLTMGMHIYQAVKFVKTFCWVCIMGAAWEFLAYVTRYFSIEHPTNNSWYEISTLLVLLAPLWINAFEYMLLGRMIHFFLPSKQILGIEARKVGRYFVFGDIGSFITQLFGGVMIIKSKSSAGFRIYTAGCVLQAVVVIIFIGLVVVFDKQVSQGFNRSGAREAKRMVIIMYLSTFVIMIRIIFRIIEFSAGVNSSLTANIEGHEFYIYVFDALPLFVALVLLNVVHPGTVLVGPDSEFRKLP
ncbi:RTA1 like protein-domain-containing protein [Xylogone sp. PMI_703]|nr:RTA1 like protein-domain-containing protein [Xylogone sp. PMI_703]